jgi:hypothetical protein
MLGIFPDQIMCSLITCKLRTQVVRVNGYEADDVVATLAEQVLQKGFRVVIASPDKDFKQLISEDVQLVMPIPEIGRWSFYTLRHYIAQYKCDPTADLSLSECLFSGINLRIAIWFYPWLLFIKLTDELEVMLHRVLYR